MVEIKKEAIDEFIREKGYTIKRFSNFVGIKKRELRKILNGDMDFKFISLVRLANFLNVPVSWLFEDEEKKVQTEFYL